ncbi:GIY-YIG nuclease family protein [Streptomyces sp. NPDC005303]|uniref:GIY-YIG nuclease family protein n=1 Tax=Streptomyces sp. NPDC005303 TaxID=3155713 RepID=UPI0033B7B4A7
MTINRRPTALYRAFDSTGQLLYVGISIHPEQRFKEHAWQKSWWRSEVARTTVEWHDTRILAAQAEARAVRDEAPERNLTLPEEDGTPRFRHLIYGRHPRPLREARVSSKRIGQFKTTDQLWATFRDAVEGSPDPEADMSKVLRQFLRWYVHEPGAKLPDRPTAGPWSKPGEGDDS